METRTKTSLLEDKLNMIYDEGEIIPIICKYTGETIGYVAVSERHISSYRENRRRGGERWNGWKGGIGERSTQLIGSTDDTSIQLEILTEE